MKILLIVLALHVVLLADKSVVKSATITKSLYPDMSLSDMKKTLLKKAKQEAAKEIYGEYLLSETVMRNGEVIDDKVRSSYGGVVHVENEPKYVDSKESLKVTIKAYATDKELKNATPQKIVIEDFCYTNPLIALKELKKAAHDAFILEAISRKKPSVKDVAEAKRAALEVHIEKESFDINTQDYKISGSVTYIPAFLHFRGPTSSSSDLIKYDEKKASKGDFYGTWRGFLMGNNTQSTFAKLEISSFAQAAIYYKNLNCSADLIVEDKTQNRVVFKEIVTFGDCQSESLITLQKVTPTSLEFVKEYDSKREYQGRLYFEQ